MSWNTVPAVLCDAKPNSSDPRQEWSFHRGSSRRVFMQTPRSPALYRRPSVGSRLKSREVLSRWKLQRPLTLLSEQSKLKQWYDACVCICIWEKQTRYIDGDEISKMQIQPYSDLLQMTKFHSSPYLCAVLEYLARAAIKKCPRLGLTQWVPELGGLLSQWLQGGCLRRDPSLACPWPWSPRGFTQPFPLCVYPNLLISSAIMTWL